MNIEFNKEEFLKNGYTSFPLVLSFIDQVKINEEINEHAFQLAPEKHGTALQCYKEADLDHSAFLTRAYLKDLENFLKEELKELLSDEFSFNEFKIHKYPDSDIGIGVHRDRQRFEEIIAVLEMDDGGDFCVYDTEKNQESEKEVPSGRGYCILMKGYNFNKEGDTRINHAVLRVTRPRTTIGARFNKKLVTVPR